MTNDFKISFIILIANIVYLFIRLFLDFEQDRIGAPSLFAIVLMIINSVFIGLLIGHC